MKKILLVTLILFIVFSFVAYARPIIYGPGLGYFGDYIVWDNGAFAGIVIR